MTSRITVTPRGVEAQKEIITEAKLQFPQLLNLKTASQTDYLSPVVLSARSARFSTDDPMNLTKYPSNRTNTDARGGSLGPRKKITSYGDNLTNTRPKYYPNYLRLSNEDYPNIHFKILTPEHPLRNLPERYPKTQRSSTDHLIKSVNLAESATKQELPIKYIHHTIFPYTRKDKPSFLKTEGSLKTPRDSSPYNSSPRNQSPRNFSPRNNSQANSPRQSLKIDIMSDYVDKSAVSGKKFADHAQTRQTEFQKKMFMNNMIITDYYSDKILKKYSNHQINRMKDRHFETQKKFLDTLKSVEHRYLEKLARIDERSNASPDFVREIKRDEKEIIESIEKQKNAENERLKQRISMFQKDKYKDMWNKFQHGARPKGKQTVNNSKILLKEPNQLENDRPRPSIRYDTSRENILNNSDE